ncbi:SWPV1-285 [Shearwaterpox virus]|uniref:SWPV1-285 n=1 Tax=Shearwaterpox virus TaxID=1974596 RepID=A0A1V0S897_CNPV|nr:SWPV1-285 [Shearwaterpox virus]
MKIINMKANISFVIAIIVPLIFCILTGYLQHIMIREWTDYKLCDSGNNCLYLPLMYQHKSKYEYGIY